jgi:hypothetical protein
MRTTLLTGLLLLGIVCYTVAAPDHKAILDLHAGHKLAPAVTHSLDGKPHQISHVTTYRLPGARVGEELPRGHHPVAQINLPGGTSIQLGKGEHRLSLNHDGTKWGVHAADPTGKVHDAKDVTVSKVAKAKVLPRHELKKGSLLFTLYYPIGQDPDGDTLFVTLGFRFD